MFNYPIPVFNIETVIEKQQTFLCEFVNLKRNGFHHYTKALNNLTYDFWKPWLDDADKNVSNYAEALKTTIRNKP
jgi:hypothetical protein